MEKKYDYLIVGSGLFGSVFAREATDKGKKCLVIEERGSIGENAIRKRKTESIFINRNIKSIKMYNENQPYI